MNELIDVQNASDVNGLQALARQGKVLRVPNNTAASVVGQTMLLRKVRVTEQGRTYTNEEGWIQADFVRSPSPEPRLAIALPEYRVLDKVGGYIDVLVPSLRVGTPTESVERIIRAIAGAEGAPEVSMYRTEAAYRANFSSSYAREHPNALRDGFLGSLTGGRFTASIYR